MRSQSGQATVEWVGLLLMVALALGALTALRVPSGERGLGELLAKRIATPEGPAAPPRRVSQGTPRRVWQGTPRRVSPRAPISRARVADAFQRLRGLRDVAKRVWVVCLGYRRFRYELERPRMPGEVMSAEEALEVADQCINPYNFLGQD